MRFGPVVGGWRGSMSGGKLWAVTPTDTVATGKPEALSCLAAVAKGAEDPEEGIR